MGFRDWAEKVNVAQVIITVTGSALAAYHTSRSVRERLWMFAAGCVFSFCTNNLVRYYVPPHVQSIVSLTVSLVGCFIVREIIAYGDMQSNTLVKYIIGKWVKHTEKPDENGQEPKIR